MTLREALSQVPDPRAANKRYPFWGLLALILVAFLCRVDSLRGVERFARANLHLLPHLGLRKPSGHTILTLLLHRLDPEKLQEALLQVFPGADPGEVLVVDGRHLRGSGRGKSPQVRLVEVLALHLLTTLAQAKAEGLKGKMVPKGGVLLRPEGEPGRAIGVGPGGVQGHGGEAASRRDRGGVEPGAGWGGGAQGDGGGEAAWSSTATRSVPCRRLPGAGSGGTGLGGPPGLSVLPAPPPGGHGGGGGLGGLLPQPPRPPALPGALCGIAVKSGHPPGAGAPGGPPCPPGRPPPGPPGGPGG